MVLFLFQLQIARIAVQHLESHRSMSAFEGKADMTCSCSRCAASRPCATEG